MAVRIRVVQDRRAVSRVIAHLDCRFAFGGADYEANILNLSIKGAYLSSRHHPPAGDDVTLTLKTPLLKKPLVMEGKVLRVGMGMAEQGSRFRFGVRFNFTPLDLVELVNRLVAQPPSFARF